MLARVVVEQVEVALRVVWTLRIRPTPMQAIARFRMY
jgi:hypothetical protein